MELNGIMKPFIIGICGISRSGKSSIRRYLESELKIKKSNIFKLDEYFIKPNKVFDTELNKEIEDWEDPRVLDFDKLYKELISAIIKETKQVDMNKLKNLNKENNSLVREFPNEIIIVEGFLLFYCEKIYNLFDIKIMLETDLDVIKERRRITKNFHSDDFDYYFKEYIVKSFYKNK